MEPLDARDPTIVRPPPLVPDPGLLLSPMPSPIPPGMPSADFPAQDLADALDGLTFVIQALADKLTTPIANGLSECEAIVGECRSAIAGGIDRTCDQVSPTIGQKRSKIVKKCSELLVDGYSYSAGCGLTYPSDDQVVQGLESGDCLGSFFTQPGMSCPKVQVVPATAAECPPCPSPFQPTSPYPPAEPLPPAEPATIVPVTIGTAAEQPVQGSSPPLTAPRPVTTVTPTTAPPPPATLPPEMQGFIGGIVQQIISYVSTFPAPPTSGGTTGTEPPEKPGVQFYPLLLGQLVQAIDPNFQGDPKLIVPGPIAVGGAVDMAAGPFLFGPPKWGDLNVCKAMEALPDGDGLDPNTRSVLGFGDIAGVLWAPEWFRKANPDYGAFPGIVAFRVMLGIDNLLTNAVQAFSVILNCPAGKVIKPVVIRLLLGVLDWFTNGAVSPLARGYDYWIAYLCPQELPSAAEANAAYLAGEIDEPTWECWLRANNQLLNPAKLAFRGQRTKPSLTELIILWRWGKITDEAFRTGARNNGVILQDDLDLIVKAAEDIPAVSDLIRMMVRDVADPKAVQKFQLDAEFEDKWQGELKRFGDAQGLSPEIARLHWRAHWEQVSSQQAFEMLHRLRPGRVPDGVVTTADDVRQLLAINDTLPFWRDRLLAISYHPLTRTDAQRAFMIGAINAIELKQTYLDEGYNDRDATILVNFSTQLKEQREARKAGSRNVSKWVNWYVKGVITLADLQRRVFDVVSDPTKRSNIIEDAKAEREFTQQANRIECVRIDFTDGRIDANDAKTKLMLQGLPLEQAAELAEAWECKRHLRRREFTAEKLCQMKERGLITQREQMIRLVNLGWKVQDAELIAKDCDRGISDRQMQVIITELRRRQTQQEKNQREAERKRKDAERAAEKAQAKAEKAAKEAAKAKKEKEKEEAKGGKK